MIVVKGDLFKGGDLLLGQGVNVRGAMGAGVAAVFAKRFPEMVQDYKRACKRGELKPGGLHSWRDEVSGVTVLNLASQDDPGPHARLEWVASSAHLALAHADRVGVSHVALPKIGCGIGGLEWEAVAGVLEQVERNARAYFKVYSLD